MSQKSNQGKAPKKSKRAISRPRSNSSAPAGLLTPDGRFWFDEDAAQRACDFFPDILRHVKGEKAGQPLVLQEWAYRDIIRPLFGWKRFDGTGSDKKIRATRRYRICYTEIPKGNAKTTIAAGIGLYALHCDDENSPEVYSVAADRFQAGISHEIAKSMTEASPFLLKRSIIYKNSIVAPARHGLYQALSSDAPTKHGLFPSCIIFDEVHTQPNRELWDTLVRGIGKRRQGLVFAITTAGDDLITLCVELHQHALDVLEDPSIDESFLAVIYAADAEEDARDPEYWAKESTWAFANPGLSVTFGADFMRDSIKRARLIVSEQNAIKRLHLNLWTEQETRWIDMGLWDANAGKVDPAALVGRECVGGLDLSSVSDITALVLLFQDPSADEGGPIYTWLPYFWLPEVRLKKQELKEDGKKKRASRDALNTELYRRWHKAGLIRVTPGNAIDYAYIRRDIADEIGKKYEIKEIAIDPWNALQIATELAGDGFPITEFRQGFASMSSPTKDLERVLLGHRLRHGGNPVLRWMARNMSVEMDASGNKKPSKEKARNKIDGIVAGIMATGIAPKVLGLEPFTGAIRTIEVR